MLELTRRGRETRWVTVSGAVTTGGHAGRRMGMESYPDATDHGRHLPRPRVTLRLLLSGPGTHLQAHRGGCEPVTWLPPPKPPELPLHWAPSPPCLQPLLPDSGCGPFRARSSSASLLQVPSTGPWWQRPPAASPLTAHGFSEVCSCLEVMPQGGCRR